MSMFDSHGDVLVTKVHKPNSLEHLRPNRYGNRPTTAWSRYTNSSRGSSRPRPSSAAPTTTSQQTTKSLMDQKIDGDYGPKMTGVISYPYSRSQKLYMDDFRALVAGSIDHPYVVSTGFNTASIPYDLLSGSNFDDDRMGARRGSQRFFVFSALRPAARAPSFLVVRSWAERPRRLALAGGIKKKWTSETRRQFEKKDMVESKKVLATGVRSECVQFLG